MDRFTVLSNTDAVLGRAVGGGSNRSALKRNKVLQRWRERSWAVLSHRVELRIQTHDCCIKHDYYEESRKMLSPAALFSGFGLETSWKFNAATRRHPPSLAALMAGLRFMFVEVRHGRHIISIRGLINVPGGRQPRSRVVCWLIPAHTFATSLC